MHVSGKQLSIDAVVFQIQTKTICFSLPSLCRGKFSPWSIEGTHSVFVSSICFSLHSILTILCFSTSRLSPTLVNLDMMRLLILIAIPLCFAAPALSTPADSYANVLADEQQAMVLNQECSTRTKVVTRTSYEINVVSTVYRYRTHATLTSNAHPEGAESTVIFGVEGTGCDMKACSICRMLNNCSDEEENW